MDGIERIAAERRRQIEVEGWTPEHDDERDAGELGRAADSYAAYYADPDTDLGKLWPFDWSWWKPTADPVRTLEKAGALYRAERERMERREQAIAAEIDRLLRERGEG